MAGDRTMIRELLTLPQDIAWQCNISSLLV